MSYLKVSIVCFIIALIALSQIGCVPTWKEVTPPVGEFKLYSNITVQDEWCIGSGGREVNGTATYNRNIRFVCNICVSTKSDDTERTMRHEIDHCWRNAVGLDSQARNQ